MSACLPCQYGEGRDVSGPGHRRNPHYSDKVAQEIVKGSQPGRRGPDVHEILTSYEDRLMRGGALLEQETLHASGVPGDLRGETHSMLESRSRPDERTQPRKGRNERSQEEDSHDKAWTERWDLRLLLIGVSPQLTGMPLMLLGLVCGRVFSISGHFSILQQARLHRVPSDLSPRVLLAVAERRDRGLLLLLGGWRFRFVPVTFSRQGYVSFCSFPSSGCGATGALGTTYSFVSRRRLRSRRNLWLLRTMCRFTPAATSRSRKRANDLRGYRVISARLQRVNMLLSVSCSRNAFCWRSGPKRMWGCGTSSSSPSRCAKSAMARSATEA